MKSTPILACLLFAASVSAETPPVQRTVTKKEMKNAAVNYRQAFAALPKLDETQKKLIDLKSIDTGEASRALVEQARNALELLHHAVADEYCTWDLDLTQGPNVPFPQIGTTQTLGRLALLRARIRAADGDEAGALADRLAVLHLAGDVAQPTVVLCRMVGVYLEIPALEALARQLPALDAGQRTRVFSQISLLDRTPTVGACVTAEANFMTNWMRQQLATKVKADGENFDPGAWLAWLCNELRMERKTLKEGERLRCGSATEARQLIDGYRIGMLELGRMCDLPDAGWNEGSAKFFAEVKAMPPKNILLSLVAPFFERVRGLERQSRFRFALMRVALDVQAKGESSLPAELAIYRKTTSGFELTSKELIDGKPVVLTIGR